MVGQSSDNAILLADRRALSYSRFGPPDGWPLLFCPGSPNSRIPYPSPGFWAAQGADIVTIERPGYGRSGRDAGRTLSSWSDDARELVDHLGWQRFAVLGLSTGGPFALALASSLPDRVTALALVSSLGRADLATGRDGMVGVMSFLSRRAPRLLATAYPAIDRHVLGRDITMRLSARLAPPLDRRLMGDPAVRRTLRESGQLALAPGGWGVVDDMRALSGSWPALGVTCPIRAWHGQDDTLVPSAPMERLIDALPGSVIDLWAGAGHMLLFEVAPEIADWLRYASTGRP